MKLYLVQHAEAKSKGEDPARPLTDKGVGDATNMAAFLKSAGVRVDEVAHSGKLRADQTARVLGPAVWPGEPVVAMDGLGPKDSTDHLMHAAEAAGGDLMVVGHQPFLGSMAARCLTGSEDGVSVAFEPGAVLCLERVEDGWVLNWLMNPSNWPPTKVLS